MEKILRVWLLWAAAVLSFAAAPAFAAGVVDGVQSPAWLDRGGLSVPVSPGIALQAGDVLRTGSGARLLLKLDEGSLVKLGENARFTIEKAQQARGGVYEAALNVAAGAFRFTTQVASKANERDVNIKLGPNATIGLRGTDLWGRGRDDKDIVCLIEGKIDITGNNGKTLRLDQPRQMFSSARNTPPEPVVTIDAQQLSAWATETEIEYGKGSKVSGEWKVIVEGFPSRDEARAATRKLRETGYPAENTANNTVTIDKFDTELAARLLAIQLRVGSGFKEIRTSR
ncbi:MAG: FecR domain-containing protein [Betaproteobacteria bacterium]|nr:FecR domain-containing protein [Betaproteobacteria bacterium]